MKFFTIEQVIELHDIFLQDHGGLAGIRDRGLLASAVEMPRLSAFGEYFHKTIYEKAAAYLFHIIQNHPFNDGNKRTGALTAILFLEENGVKIVFSEKDFEEHILAVAKGQKQKDEIAYFLEYGKERSSNLESSHLFYESEIHELEDLLSERHLENAVERMSLESRLKFAKSVIAGIKDF